MRWTILRATQFHEFADRLLRQFTRLPLVFLPKNWQFQVISAGEVAEHLVAALQQGPSGRLPDIGGPEILRLEELARLWLAAQGRRRRLIHLPIPGGLSVGFRQGLNTTPGHSFGTMTWSEWLDEHYARAGESEKMAASGNVNPPNHCRWPFLCSWKASSPSSEPSSCCARSLTMTTPPSPNRG